MSVLIMPHRVAISHPTGSDFDWRAPYNWCVEHAGIEDMDTGEWFVNSFNNSQERTYIFRFLHGKTAMMFKLTWGGA